jgi:hypothetical protein
MTYVNLKLTRVEARILKQLLESHAKNDLPEGWLKIFDKIEIKLNKCLKEK